MDTLGLRPLTGQFERNVYPEDIRGCPVSRCSATTGRPPIEQNAGRVDARLQAELVRIEVRVYGRESQLLTACIPPPLSPPDLGPLTVSLESFFLGDGYLLVPYWHRRRKQLCSRRSVGPPQGVAHCHWPTYTRPCPFGGYNRR